MYGLGLAAIIYVNNLLHGYLWIFLLFCSWHLNETGKRTQIWQMVKANSGQFPGYDQWGPLHLQGSCPHTQVVVTVTAAVLPEEAVGDAPVRDAGAQGFPFLLRRWAQALFPSQATQNSKGGSSGDCRAACSAAPSVLKAFANPPCEAGFPDPINGADLPSQNTE